jgi:hypothetical protein
MHRTILTAALAFLAGLATLSSAQAKGPLGIGGGEIDRQYRPGPYTPYDGAGFMHRVNFEAGPALFFGYDGRRLAYLDYLDRLERQQCFGHLWPSAKCGPVYQIQRIEREYWQNWAFCCPTCFGW